MSGRMLLWGRTGPFVLTKALQFLEHLQALQFLEHLIDVLSILLRCTDFAGIQKAVVDQSSSKPPNSDHDPFFGASLALGSALDLLRGSTSDLVMLWNPLFNTDHNLIKKWFIIVPNGSSLRRLRDDDASEWQFFFFFWFATSSCGTHFSSFFPFPVCFKCQTTVGWLTLSSWATSYVIVRGSASMTLSVGRWQLLMVGHCAPHLQGLEPSLHCMFISSSRAKCSVDAASYLFCFMTQLQLE